MDTPEFLAWAIEYTCPIRGFQDGRDPERTERQLRAARAVSDARVEGRVYEGLCVDPPNGFRIEEALNVYGGSATAERHCLACPANSSPRRLAGCFGLLPVCQSLRESVERVASDHANGYEHIFQRTSPRWYGLWMQPPLQGAKLTFLRDVLEATEICEIDQPQIASLRAGVETATATQYPLHTALYPPGRVEGPWWRLASHCRRCKAVWSTAKSRHCGTCGYIGHPAPEKKRHARGLRPYLPLASMLGERAAAEFLVRYGSFRKQPESMPWAETRLP
jgi:hypothetical protein